jgi:hypothetical protein
VRRAAYSSSPEAFARHSCRVFSHTFSRLHLGALFDAGFVQRERDGRQTWYWVNTDGVQAIRQLLDPEPEVVKASR